MPGYVRNRKGYNLTLWYKDDGIDRIVTSIVKSRSECNRLTKHAENNGCYAWQVTYLSEDYE